METNQKLWLACLAVPALMACAKSPASVRATAGLCSAPSTAGNARAARAFVDSKDYKEGVGLARAVLDLCPAHPEAATALGKALVEQAKYKEAVERMTEVLRADDDVADAYLWRGYAYKHLGKTDLMAADLEAFLKLAPKAPQAETARAMLNP